MKHRVTVRAVGLVMVLYVAGGVAFAGEMPGVLAADAELEELATGYDFTEGPAVAPDGAILFTDIPNSLILRYDPATGETTTYRENSGGANGLMFDSQGRLVACEDRVTRRVTRTSVDGEIVVLAEGWQGKRFNGPNDLVIDAHGGIYFTDPVYGKKDVELNVEAVYYIAADGELSQIIADLQKPNGVVLSPDGGVLYVADNTGQKIVAYDVLGAGELGEPRVFAEMAFDKPWQGPDGMTVDDAGRLYVAAVNAVHVFDATGEKLGKIAMPGFTTNCTIAEDYLYITSNKGLYRVRLAHTDNGY